MNETLFKEIAFKAGFTGSDLSNTQFGTNYEHALKIFIALIIEECAEVMTDQDEFYGGFMSRIIKQHFEIKL